MSVSSANGKDGDIPWTTRPRRASFVTRIFGHFMDLFGTKHGTWIVGALYLDSCPSKERVREELVMKRIFTMSRFYSVLKVNSAFGEFVPMKLEDFDWDYHLNYAFEDKVVNELQLLEFIGNLHNFRSGLDPSKPLWKVVVIPKFDFEDGRENLGAVVITVTNHAIGDGISTVGVLLRTLDDSPIDPALPLNKQHSVVNKKASAARGRSGTKKSKAVSMKSVKTDSPKVRNSNITKAKAGKEPKKESTNLPELITLEAAENENEVVEEEIEEIDEVTAGNAVSDEEFVVKKRKNKPDLGMMTKVRMFFYGIWAGATSIFATEDPPNALKLDRRDKKFFEKYEGSKLLAKSQPIKLDEIKALKNKFAGGTVNDILLAVLSMTVKSYLLEIGDANMKETRNFLRGQFPVSVRGRNEALLKDNNPANKWQNMAFTYPFDYTDAVDCFFKVKRQLDKIKVSPQVYVQHSSQAKISLMLPRKLLVELGLKTATQASTLLSNVPGPQRKVHLLGAAVEDIAFYLFAPVGLYLGLLSYNGQISLSVNMDGSLGLDPKDLARHWNEQYTIFKKEVDSYQAEEIPKDEKRRSKVNRVNRDDINGFAIDIPPELEDAV